MVPVTPQVVGGSQAWALAEEVVVLASSMEHFGEQEPILPGAVPHWWSESSQASRLCTTALCAFKIDEGPGRRAAVLPA